jgi:hypothetical protein
LTHNISTIGCVTLEFYIQLYFTLISSGLVVSYVDLVFVTQSRNMRTNIARFLYLTPPVMTLPMAYITSREVLGSAFGEDKIWTYAAAAVPPGCIWGAFSKYFMYDGKKKFGIFLKSIGMPDFMLECALHVDQSKKRDVTICQNCINERTLKKVRLQTFRL